MNWEKSKSLTDIKRDFLNHFFDYDDRFFLTGGSALSIFYLDHRFSYDLDLFTPEKIDWHLLDNEIREISDKIGASQNVISSSLLHKRYQLKRKDECEIIDFVIEKVPPLHNKNTFGKIKVDTAEEIGVNKICTLVSRSEIKDIIDLYFLSRSNFDIVGHLNDSMKKDSGLNASTLSFILNGIKVKEIPEYMIRNVTPDELNQFINDLRKKLAEVSFPDNLTCL